MTSDPLLPIFDSLLGPVTAKERAAAKTPANVDALRQLCDSLGPDVTIFAIGSGEYEYEKGLLVLTGVGVHLAPHRFLCWHDVQSFGGEPTGLVRNRFRVWFLDRDLNAIVLELRDHDLGRRFVELAEEARIEYWSVHHQ